MAAVREASICFLSRCAPHTTHLMPTPSLFLSLSLPPPSLSLCSARCYIWPALDWPLCLNWPRVCKASELGLSALHWYLHLNPTCTLYSLIPSLSSLPPPFPPPPSSLLRPSFLILSIRSHSFFPSFVPFLPPSLLSSLSLSLPPSLIASPAQSLSSLLSSLPSLPFLPLSITLPPPPFLSSSVWSYVGPAQLRDRTGWSDAEAVQI